MQPRREREEEELATLGLGLTQNKTAVVKEDYAEPLNISDRYVMVFP